jgi:hypothetical protein
MALFNRLFDPADPSGRWPSDPEFILNFDLSTLALSGVRPGDPVHPLSPLGPAEDSREAARGTLRYPSRGVQIDVDGSTVTGIVLFLDSYRGDFISNGLPHAAPRTREDLARLGEPYWIDRDEDEMLLFYEFGTRELQVELSLDGAIRAFVAVTPPMMADPDQRRAYRVDKPWPPTRS